MAYENVKLRYPNMTVDNTYFYTFDVAYNSLMCKVDDGDMAFNYPLDIDFDYVGSTGLTGSYTTHYDGFYFWTLQRIDGNNGIVVRTWDIHNKVICTLDREFIYANDSYNTYVSSAMGIENYHTTLTSGVNAGDTIIEISEYYDNIVVSGTKLYIGPNLSGGRESVTVSGVNVDQVVLSSGTLYSYDEGDEVHIVPSFLIFNEYSGTSSSGSLMRFDAHTGELLSRDTSSEYKSVSASTFYRLEGLLSDYPDAHSLIYVKGAQAKLRNMSDLLSVYEAESRNEDFTGADYSYPDEDDWERTGTPYIVDNRLFLNTVIDGTDRISSIYRLTNDFGVQISGSIGDYIVYDADDRYFEHYLGVTFGSNDIRLGYTRKPDLIGPDYLYAEYTMDSVSGSVLIDSSGNGYHGTLYGNPTQVSGARNPGEYVMDFDGSGDAALLLTHSEAAAIEDLCSISFWFRSETTSGDSASRVISRDLSDYYGFRLYQDSGFPQSALVYYSDTQTTNLGYIVDSGWHHVVMSWDTDNNKFRVFFDNDEKFSTTSFDRFTGASRPLVLACNTESSINPGANEFNGKIDNVRIYNRYLLDEEVAWLYNDRPDEPAMYVSYNDSFQVLTTLSGDLTHYKLRIDRLDNDYYCYYKTSISGVVFDPSWTLLHSLTGSDAECGVELGLISRSVTVSGAYFDDLVYTSGQLFYPTVDTPFYGIMQMDNVKSNGSTLIDVFDLATYGDSLYRLQDEATYYGNDYSWSSYNYQVSPIRSFVNSISVTAYPIILPANGLNVSALTAIVQDQYGEGAVNVPVFFVDDDDIGFVTISPAYTDLFIKTGEANSNYKSGTEVRTVTIEGTVTQYD